VHDTNSESDGLRHEAGSLFSFLCMKFIICSLQIYYLGDQVENPGFEPRSGHVGQEDFWYSFLLGVESSPGRIRSIEESNYLIGNGARDLPDCSTVTEPTTLPRAPVNRNIGYIILALKCSVFRAVTPCSSETARSFGETYRLIFGSKSKTSSTSRLLLLCLLNFSAFLFSSTSPARTIFLDFSALKIFREG
jgi:hypothetical protein